VTYHQPLPPPRAAAPRRSTADVVISISLVVLTVLFGAGAAVMGFFLLAFLDHCPPATCSIDGAVTAVGTAVVAAVAIALVGFTVTVVALVRRKPAWPFALATFVLCGVAFVLGGVGYDAAVGG
jgi:sterol desaturase/sphingolipid hydroxylase (fatty acid hydroxylase superfamily)